MINSIKSGLARTNTCYNTKYKNQTSCSVPDIRKKKLDFSSVINFKNNKPSFNGVIPGIRTLIRRGFHQKPLSREFSTKLDGLRGHLMAVSRYAESIAKKLGLPIVEVQQARWGGLFHDLGKLKLPENILNKPGPLTPDEWVLMKQHPEIGGDILKSLGLSDDVIEVVRCHHENINGLGYPQGLREDTIPLAARIVSVADSFHALTADRPYRRGMGIDKATKVLKEGAGSQWDPDIVEVFNKIVSSLHI